MRSYPPVVAPRREFLLSEILLGPEEEEAVLRVVRSRWLSMGPEVQRLEAEFAIFAGAKHVLATANCTAALHLAMLALDVGPGDEVIVPALSFVATANAALYCGARIVFADVESVSRPTLDPADVARKLTSRTKAIVAMHYAGYPCRMDALAEVARDVPIVEDAAHCAGSRFHGRACGTIGRIGCFSLFGNKNLPAGEGGLIATDDPALFERMHRQRSHGMTSLSWDRARGHASSYDVTTLGYNYRMPELSAAIARAQLAKLPAHNAARDAVFAAYMRDLARIRGVTALFADADPPGSRHLMPVLLDNAARRGDVMARLKERGVQTSIHYPPIYSFSYLRDTIADCPNTDAFASRVVTLPFHPGLSKDDVATICGHLATVMG